VHGMRMTDWSECQPQLASPILLISTKPSPPARQHKQQHKQQHNNNFF
jgi:hypothetical protein